jgi:hypothetical protein
MPVIDEPACGDPEQPGGGGAAYKPATESIRLAVPMFVLNYTMGYFVFPFHNVNHSPLHSGR